MTWTIEGVRLLVAPDLTLAALAFVGTGICLGVVSGLTPGLHVNTLALLVAASVPLLPGGTDPALVGAAILAVGVPDAAMAVTTLPGHRLVLAGRGREALRLSALGSGAASLAALLLGWPVTVAMRRVVPFLDVHLPVVLAVVACALLAGEPTTRRRVGGVLALAASGAVGALVLDARLSAPLGDGDVLLPVFSGLFGLPVLLTAFRGRGVPPQEGPEIPVPRSLVGVAAVAGTVSGALVSYVSGVSSAVAATLSLSLLPSSEAPDRAFVVATSGVNTANTIFALYALVAFREAHTGVLVALNRAGSPLDLPLLLASVAVAAAAGFVLVPAVGDYYLRAVGRVDNRRLCVGVALLVAALSWLLAGWFGVAVLVGCALVGLVPLAFGARRVHLMGVLFVPLALGV